MCHLLYNHNRANGGLDKKDHSVVLNLKEEIKADESKYFIRGRGCEVILMKTDETAPYWIRLLKEPTKFHWLRVDFNKWQDEDDSGDEASGPGGFGGGGADFEEMMRSMGGLGGGGMPGMDFGGAGLDNFEENDSDEEGLPDLEDGTPEDNKDQTDGDKTTKADDTKVGSENPTGAASDATA